jgi:syntaxin 18
MIEISELQSTLAINLEMQATRIDMLVEDAGNTTENVTGGNKQLKRATERWRPARMVFYASCGLCAFLVTWDLIF